MRLIDSHCHLNYLGLAERQDECWPTPGRAESAVSSTFQLARMSGPT